MKNEKIKLWLKRGKVFLFLVSILQVSIFSNYLHAEEEKEVIQKYQDKKNSDTMVMLTNSVALLTFSFVGISLPLMCKSQTFKAPSAMVFVGTAAYYLLMEVINFKNYKKASDRVLEIIPEQDYETQLAELEKARDITEEARKYVEKKANNAKIAAMGAAAATVIAGIEALTKKGDIKCSKEESNEKKDGVQDINVPEKVTFNFPNKKVDTQIQNAILLSKSTTDAYLLYEEWENFYNHELSSPSTDRYQQIKAIHSSSPEIFATGSFSLKESLANFIEMSSMIFGEILPSAHAAEAETESQSDDKKSKKNYTRYFPLLGIAAGGAIAVVIAKSKSKIGAKLFEKAGSRMIVFGANAGIAFLVYSLSKKLVKTLAERRDRYQTLIDELKKLITQRSLAGGDNGVYTPKSLNTKLPSTLTAAGSPNDSKGACVNRGLQVDADCSCRIDNACLSIETPDFRKTFSGTAIPSSLAQLTNDLTKGANNAFNGNLEAANASAAQIGKFAKATKQLRLKTQDEINKQRLKQGQSPISFSDKISGLQKSITDSIQGGLSSSSGGSQGPSSSGGLNLANSPTENQSELPSAMSGRSLALLGGGFAESFEDFNLGTNNTATPNLLDAEELPAYDYGDSDITDDGASIWQKISNRYLITVFPKIFKEKAPASEMQQDNNL